MQKSNHIIWQTSLTCLQYLIPAFLFTHLTKEQGEAIAMSLGAIQATLAITHHITEDKKESNTNVVS
jgi:hypothetical protein